MRTLSIVLLTVTLGAQAQETAPPAPPPEVVAAPVSAAASDPADEEFEKAAFFGKKFFDLENYGSAFEQFAKAEALRPDHPAILYNMALVLAKAGRFAESQVKVDRYNQLYPGGAEKPLVTKLQFELEFQRELEKARQANQEYLELFNRGKYHYSRNDLDAALRTFQEAEQRQPTDPAAPFNQAVVYEKKGDLAKAVERFRRYGELELDPARKAEVDQRIFALDNEINDMRTKLVCSFCGHRIPEGSHWCHRCWRGPYDASSPVWNSRPCVEGATATRSTFFLDNRLHKNDALTCMIPGGTMREALRYSPTLQRAIQDARKAEGWTYQGEVIQEWTDKHGNQVRYVQGPGHLERIISTSTGESLEFEAHAGPNGRWLLDREDIVIEGQKYTSRYTFDANERITRHDVTYRNASACNHLIAMTANFNYDNDRLVSATIDGGYDGFPSEGSPTTKWQVTVAYVYDPAGRLMKEDLTLASFQKTYAQRPRGALREETSRMYVSMRPKRPIENAIRVGDLCATSGNQLLANFVDLRPFYSMSPNLAIALPLGVTRASVSFTYPESFLVR
jgi:Tfp pilus assembly protein PilF